MSSARNASSPFSTTAWIDGANSVAKTRFNSSQESALTSATDDRVGELDDGLSNSAEPLPQQRLDGFDPRAVIGNRNLLAESHSTLRATASRPGLPRGTGRSFQENATDRLDLLRGNLGQRWAHRTWRTRRAWNQLERIGLDVHRDPLTGVPALQSRCIDRSMLVADSRMKSAKRTVRCHRAACASVTQLPDARRRAGHTSIVPDASASRARACAGREWWALAAGGLSRPTRCVEIVAAKADTASCPSQGGKASGGRCAANRA